MNRRILALSSATMFLLGASVPAAGQGSTGTATAQAGQAVTQAATAAAQSAAAAGRAASTAAASAARQIEREVIRTAQTRAGVPQRSEFKFEQTNTQTQKLAVGSSGQISLRNIVGDITVKVGGGSEATLEILKVSRGRTEADAKMGLEKVTVDVVVRSERATVEAKYPDDRRPDYAVAVSYTVTAPAGTSVSAGTVSGNVSLTGLKGDVSAHAISGKIDVNNCSKVSEVRATSGTITLTNVQSAGDLTVEGVAGAVNLTGVKARKVSASMVSGDIIGRDVQADAAVMSTMSGDISYVGSVTPKGRYEFRAHSGTVKLGLTGGFDLEARTFSGRVEAEPGLGIPASTTSKHSLVGTAGNGGASVIATTFSGSVWVGRKIN